MDNRKKIKLLVIDFNNILFRSLYISKTVSSSKNGKSFFAFAFLIFFRIIFSILKNRRYSLVIACLDSKPRIRDSRQRIFPEYKKGRSNPWKKFFPSLVQTSLEFFSIAKFVWWHNHFSEADDLIGSVVNRFEQKSDYIDILSNDEDLRPLVSEKIRLLTGKKSIQRVSFLENKKSFSFFSDFRVLTGDKSDKIKGIRGVSSETALYFLSKYNSLGGILNSTDFLPPRLRKIFNNRLVRRQLIRNISLMKLRTDLLDDNVLVYNLFDYRWICPLHNFSFYLFLKAKKISIKNFEFMKSQCPNCQRLK